MQWEVRRKRWLRVAVASVAEELEEEAAEQGAVPDRGAPVPAECSAVETLGTHLTARKNHTHTQTQTDRQSHQK